MANDTDNSTLQLDARPSHEHLATIYVYIAVLTVSALVFVHLFLGLTFSTGMGMGCPTISWRGNTYGGELESKPT